MMLLKVYSIKVSQPGKEYDTKIFNILRTPNIIRELFNSIRTTKFLDGVGYQECLNLILKSKYEKSMRDFWDAVGKVCSTDNDKILRDPFIFLINSQIEYIKINGAEKKCQDIIVNNLITEKEFENPFKQREMRTIMLPFFSPEVKPNDTLKHKNIITAFIGTHRNTDQSKDLISKLNGK